MRDDDMRLSARDKVVQKMSRDGAVENNISADTSKRVSKRIADATLKNTPASELQLGGRATHRDMDAANRNNRYSGYLKKIRQGSGGTNGAEAVNLSGADNSGNNGYAVYGSDGGNGNGGESDIAYDDSPAGSSHVGTNKSSASGNSGGGGSKRAAVDGRYNLKSGHNRLHNGTGSSDADGGLQEKSSSLKLKNRLKKKQARLQYQSRNAGGNCDKAYDSGSSNEEGNGDIKPQNAKQKKKASRLRFDDELLQNAGNGMSGTKGSKSPGTKRLLAYGGMNTAKNTVSKAAHASDVGDGDDDNACSDALKEGEGLAGRAALLHGRSGSNSHGYFETDEGGLSKTSSLKHEPQDKKSALRFGEDTKSSKGASVKKSNGESKNKAIQKKRIKKDYAEAVKNGGGDASKASAEAVKDTVEKAKKAAVGFAKRHPAVIAIAAVIGLFGILAVSTAGTFGAIVSEVGSAVTDSTYLSSDNDILAANDTYTDMEDRLQDQVDNIKSTYPGYDEYRYQVDEITHDPYALTSYLTAMYGNFKVGDISSDLEMLFQDQFHLELCDEVETRTRTVTNDDGTTSEEEYEVTVLNVKVTNKGLDTIATESLGSNQKKLYSVYQASLGNRSYLFGDSITIGNPADGGMGYEIPREALDDEEFANMIREAEKYLGMAYVWGGYSPTGGFDCSGFVSYVINHCGNGWNVGRLTANGLRGICAPVSSSDAKPGDLIFFQGTYNTSGASHVGIYVGNGMMIHCGNPIQYTSINSNYWQQHFLSFGRIGE